MRLFTALAIAGYMGFITLASVIVGWLLRLRSRRQFRDED